jgi:hypothetical protein
VFSFFIQTVFIVIAAVLVTLNRVSDRPFQPGTFSSGTDASHPEARTKTNFLDLAPIAFLAFQAAGQVCFSRTLGVFELPTIVLSTLYHDITADLYGMRQVWKSSTGLLDFLWVQYRRQEKRLASVIALFVGAVVGSEMFKSRAGMSGTLWIASGLKFAVAGMFILWRKDASEEQNLSS